MNPRMVRLSKLVSRELNLILHTSFRELAEKISITETIVSPDLHDAYIYFSVIGDDCDIISATKFLTKTSKILRQKLFQKIRLKFSPRLNFRHDDSMSRGQRIIQILDNLQTDE